MVGSNSVATYFGPSFMVDDLTYEYEDYNVDSVLINCHYPVSADKFVLQYGIIVKKSDRFQGEAADAMAANFGTFIAKGFEQDVEIWKNKTRIENPLLCEEDGPVYQLRRWYEQFYVDVADIAPEMTERFEFELDTARPVAAWQKEVEDNLAAKKAGRRCSLFSALSARLRSWSRRTVGNTPPFSGVTRPAPSASKSPTTVNSGSERDDPVPLASSAAP